MYYKTETQNRAPPRHIARRVALAVRGLFGWSSSGFPPFLIVWYKVYKPRCAESNREQPQTAGLLDHPRPSPTAVELYLANAAFAWNDLYMPKRNKHKRPNDVNQFARRPVMLSTSKQEGIIKPPTKAQISLLMAELGRKGGKRGGKRRLETMTSEERSDAARNAALARWKRS